MSTYILGINSVYHELSACLLKDGKLIAAVEEERFTRLKHGKPALIDNPEILPQESIKFCLKKADINFDEIAKIGISFQPQARLKNIGLDKNFVEGDWGSRSGEEIFFRKLMSIPRLLSEFAGCDVSPKIVWVPHHISHAGSAFYVSPFNEAAILTVDGIGETTSTWLGLGKGNEMQVIKEIVYPNSIGFMWEKLSKFLGFSEYDASKVMGLASYGDPKKYASEFKKIVKFKPEGEFTTDLDILRFRADDYGPLEKLFGVKKLATSAERTPEHEAIAAALQAITNEMIIHLATFLAKKTKAENICLAGGVALNCVSNYELMRSGLFKNMYIQPAANDAGTALGAAGYIWSESYFGQRSFVMDNTYWGPEFSDAEVEAALKKEKVTYQKLENISAETAKLLAAGKIIGWFQGKMEWGPRALGNRSLLVDPRDRNMKETLNLRIKKRESFRPFAPSVLSEYAADWFEIPTICNSVSTEFMEFAFPVKKSKRELVPAITHVDGTSRIQTVKREINPKYHLLLSEFYRITGVPMVLNTSFNENEPIVCTPLDAIRTFQRTKMDYLAINNFLVKKE